MTGRFRDGIDKDYMVLAQQLLGGRAGLVDLSDCSMDELSHLEDDLLNEVLGRLLQPCGGSGARVWNNDAAQ